MSAKLHWTMWLCGGGCMFPRCETHGYFFQGRLKTLVYLMNIKGANHLRQSTADVFVCVYAGITRKAALMRNIHCHFAP